MANFRVLKVADGFGLRLRTDYDEDGEPREYPVALVCFTTCDVVVSLDGVADIADGLRVAAEYLRDIADSFDLRARAEEDK